MNFVTFPDGFLFGASISNYQHFGGLVCDLPLIDASKHSVFYEVDFKILRELGLNAFRTGVDWARIEPEEDKIDQNAIRFYHEYLSRLKETGVTTIIDLYHIGNPRWIHEQGGWTSKEIVEKFLRYVELASSEYDQYIDYYQVLNEPWAAAMISSRPSQEGDLAKQIDASLNSMNEAIRKSYDIIHEKNSQAKVGVSNPLGPSAILVGPEMATATEQTNEDSMKTLMKNIEDWMYGGIEVQEGKFDYIGVNYYGLSVMTGLGQFGTMIVYPDGLRDICRNLSKKYSKPILVTENGLPNRDDDQKTAFLLRHLKSLHDAITHDNADIIGYCWWSFLPGWEGFYGRVFNLPVWQPFFGLVDVDLIGNYERKPTQTALDYGEIAKNRGFSTRLYERSLAQRSSIRYEDWL